METVKKFYADRIKTGLLSVLMFVAVYILYAKVLSDPYGITAAASVILWGLVAIAFFIGVVYVIKTVDPRPVVEMNHDGMIIRTFVVFEEFVPWDEVEYLGREQVNNRIANTAGLVKVSTNFLRIYRPKRRSLAINLTLLKHRGNELEDAIVQFISRQSG